MSKKKDWSGAEKHGVGVLVNCLAEKLEIICSLIGAAEKMHEVLSSGNKYQKGVADIFEHTVVEARKTLLSHIDN